MVLSFASSAVACAVCPSCHKNSLERRNGRVVFLPAHNRTPLVVYLWQVTIGMYDIFIEITEKCLGCRSDTQTLRQFVQSALRHPCHFRRKSLHMIFFFFEKALRDKERHVYIFNTGLFKSAVQFFLDVFPDGISRRLEDHTAS